MGKAWKGARNICDFSKWEKTSIKKSLGDDSGGLPWGQLRQPGEMSRDTALVAGPEHDTRLCKSYTGLLRKQFLPSTRVIKFSELRPGDGKGWGQDQKEMRKKRNNILSSIKKK